MPRRREREQKVRKRSEDASSSPDEEVFGSAEGFAPDLPLVIWASGGFCKLFVDGAEVDCTIAPELGRGGKGSLVVGDRVELDPAQPTRVVKVLPRKSVLARPDPQIRQRQRVLVANIDVVIHVVSVKAPPIRVRLIDRFLIAIQRGRAQPVICVNKIDLVDRDTLSADLALLNVYREIGIPVIACSTATGEGLNLLQEQIRGRLSALVGHSGVGKSSVLNALNEELNLTTGELHRRGTGRHTTSASTLYDLGDHTWLIDTPGIREFGLWDLDRDSLRDYFPEFNEPAESCRFTDCSHIHEPDCEVKNSVENRFLSKHRYDTYVRLYEELTPQKA